MVCRNLCAEASACFSPLDDEFSLDWPPNPICKTLWISSAPSQWLGLCTIPLTPCSTLLKSEAQTEALENILFPVQSLLVWGMGFSCRRSSSAGINFHLQWSSLLTHMMLQRPLWDNANARLQLTGDFLSAVLEEGVGPHHNCLLPPPTGHSDVTTSPGKQGHSLEKSKCLSWQTPAHPNVLSVESQFPLTPQEGLPCQIFSCCLFEAVRFNSF